MLRRILVFIFGALPAATLAAAACLPAAVIGFVLLALPAWAWGLLYVAMGCSGTAGSFGRTEVVGLI
ncbi:MAG: hypothetical protein AAFM91_09380 [Pseudomonadota bacterium]